MQVNNSKELLCKKVLYPHVIENPFMEREKAVRFQVKPTIYGSPFPTIFHSLARFASNYISSGIGVTRTHNYQTQLSMNTFRSNLSVYATEKGIISYSTQTYHDTCKTTHVNEPLGPNNITWKIQPWKWSINDQYKLYTVKWTKMKQFKDYPMYLMVHHIR